MSGTDGPVVHTTGGAVRGMRAGDVLSFRGIPYAAPPCGPLRFAPPVRGEPWTGIRLATDWGPISPQGATPHLDALGVPALPQSEDCLVLNVWTPAADRARRPVMVWIHGGGFVGGSASVTFQHGDRLAARGDVVVVSCNYRLGALGFLHLAELDPALRSSGLNGTRDQVAALEWVRDNIAAFGGDPGNVTIFGSSAGAVSVATLLTLPAARGLFHRAIAQSGALDILLHRDEAAARTRRMCTLTGATSVGDLRALGTDALLDAQATLRAELADAEPADCGGWGALSAFTPVVDGHCLDAPPIVKAQRGDLAPVDLLLGTNAEEWRFLTILGHRLHTDEELANAFEGTLDDPHAAVATYRRRLGAHAPTRDVHDAMMTDRVFRVPMHRLADASVAAGNPTYLYRFAYTSPALDGALGACHGLEVPFVFDHREGPLAMFVGEHSPDHLAAAMQDAWIAFARTGDPNHPGLPRWDPQHGERRPVLRFDEHITVLDDPERAEREVWYRAP